jgi:hypothetical protein
VKCMEKWIVSKANQERVCNYTNSMYQQQQQIVLLELICSAVQHRHHFAGKYFTIFLEIWLK